MISNRLLNDQFPKSNAYHPEWVLGSVSGGANALWLAEWLTSALELKPEMNVLDLGCGRAMSSVFLAREFGVKVWAADLWFSPSENLKRVQDAGVSQQVYPLRVQAEQLPFAVEFFDAIVSIDAFPYFGTDDHYLGYLARFVKPGGAIAIAQAGFVDELGECPPPHLAEWLTLEPALRSMHSSAWWRRHWQWSGVVDVELADCLPEGWSMWLQEIAPDNLLEIQAIQSDQGRNMTYNRIVARRCPQITLEDPISSIPQYYDRAPLLRS